MWPPVEIWTKTKTNQDVQTKTILVSEFQKMTKPDHFCLKWNDFSDHLHTTFTGLLSSSQTPLFSDVTLACDDGKQLLAHRLVLAGCSSVLKSILTSTAAPNNQHCPLLYLRGVSKEDLTALLTFMYQGEVSLPQEQLNSFLAVAEDLQVKGLVENSKPGKASLDAKCYSKLSHRSNEVVTAPQHKKVRVNPEKNDSCGIRETSVKFEHPTFTNVMETNSASHVLEPDPYSKYAIAKVDDEGYDNLDSYGDGDLIQDHLSASTPSFSERTWPDGRTEWTCSLCAKVFHHPGSTSQHIAVHQGRTTCNECGKIFNRVSDMRTHCRNVHQIYDLQ